MSEYDENIGVRISCYQIKSLYARGALGVVYVAEHIDLGVHVVVSSFRSLPAQPKRRVLRLTVS